MKDSGVEWIGEIPEDWETQKVKFLFSIKKRIAGREGYTVLSITQKGIVPKNLDSNEGQMAQDYSKYQLVHAGDYAMNHMDLLTGWIDISSYEGVTSPDYRVFVANEPESIACKFYLYFFQCCYANKIFYGMGQGVSGFGRWRLPAEQFLNFRAPYPSLNEQISISSILDARCAEIDKVVEQTRTTIEEYKKLKQAIITEAVTKGVRGPRPMKPSGVEWISDIPEEWSRSRVGLHYHVILGKMLCNTQQNDEYTLEPYFCAADIHFGAVDKAKKEMWFSSAEKDMYRVMPGDLLVVEGGAGAGGCAVVKDCETAMYIQNSVMIVRGKKSCSVAYLGYWIESLVKRAYIDVVCNKATIPHFTKDKLSSVPIPLPSSEEQQEIAAYLDTKCAEIDRIIGKKERLIEELGSYKKSLIYEYVTGKKQVLYK